MSNEYQGRHRAGRLEIAQVPVRQVRRLPCDDWCLICKDIQHSAKTNHPMYDNYENPCDLCSDCSGTPEWTIS